MQDIGLMPRIPLVEVPWGGSEKQVIFCPSKSLLYFLVFSSVVLSERLNDTVHIIGHKVYG